MWIFILFCEKERLNSFILQRKQRVWKFRFIGKSDIVGIIAVKYLFLHKNTCIDYAGMQRTGVLETNQKDEYVRQRCNYSDL